MSQRAFLDLCVQVQALQFGEFPLKSGRICPYHFDAGQFQTGEALAQVGHFYREAIAASGIPFDMLFGAAYKGIPLVCATAMAYATAGSEIPYSFNRKESKSYGDGGDIVGAPIAGKVLIISDIITAISSVRETIQLVEGKGADVSGIMVLIDRQECSPRSDLSAIEAVEQEFGVPVKAIITLADIFEYVSNEPSLAEYQQAIEHYHAEYGVGDLVA